jgi:hypothetical protein
MSLLCGAGANAQPAPRVTLDVGIEMPAGFALRFTALGPRVAVAEDGTIVVVVGEHRQSPSTSIAMAW